MARYKGRHAKRVHPKYFTILLVFLLMSTISGTTAFLTSKGSIKNEFVLGEVQTQIMETFNAKNKVKEDVKIKNSGNVPIFVRTAIVINWKDSDGKILNTAPEKDVDYTISFSTSQNWVKSSDGYYYYKNTLDVNQNTDILIEECTQIKEYEDRTLEVSIVTQGIQAEPEKAVKEAWDVDVINNCIDVGGE